MGGVLTACPRGTRATVGVLGDTEGVLGGAVGVLGPPRGSEVRVRVRACACVCTARVLVRLSSLCSFVCGRAGGRARARVRACMRAHVSACVFGFAFPSDCIFRARVCSERVCVLSERACALRRCARPPIARRRRAVSMARPAPRVAAACTRLRSVPPAGSARVGRRCHVDEPHGQRAVGCAIWAHVRGRRRRRHLRHRRLRQHPLPGRVGEHRRRCAAGLCPGVGRWGTQEVLAGVTQGY
jgi:hypothetical protein